MSSKSRDSMTRKEFNNHLKYLKSLYKNGAVEWLFFEGFVIIFLDSFFYEQIELED